MPYLKYGDWYIPDCEIAFPTESEAWEFNHKATRLRLCLIVMQSLINIKPISVIWASFNLQRENIYESNKEKIEKARNIRATQNGYVLWRRQIERWNANDI